MSDPIDRLMVDTSLMPILVSRIGMTVAANLLDDLAHGSLGADYRIMAVLGMTTNDGSLSFRPRDSGGDELGEGLPSFQSHQVLDYRTVLGPGVAWDGVHAIIKGTLPETLTTALVGQPLKALVNHPDLDPTLMIDHAFEEPNETYFGTTVRISPPITIREALGDEVRRLTVTARRIRKIRRRIMLAKTWRTDIHTSATFTLVTMMALALGWVEGLFLASSDARILLVVMAICTAVALGPFVIWGFYLRDAQERLLGTHYDHIAFGTKVRIEKGHDAKGHLSSLARTLTG